MDKKEYIQSLKTRTEEELLYLLKIGQKQEIKTDPDQLNYVIQELNARNLSEINYLEFKRLLSYFSDLFPDNPKFELTENRINHIIESEEQNLLKKEESPIEQAPTKKDKYEDLKFIAGLILNLTYLVLLVGLIMCIFVGGKFSFLMGAIYFVFIFVGSLFSIAFAKLIFVFIDIYENTLK